MKAATAIGIGIAFAGMLMGAMMEGSTPMSFFNMPAILIVFGGTFGVTLAATSMEAIKKIPAMFKLAMSPPVHDVNERIELLVGYSEKARRDGLLALESEVAGLGDPFARKGLQLVVDGTEPDLVRDVLYNEIDGASARHALNRDPFEKAGGFCPTIGILGCVMGLVHVLGNLDKPETLGPSIAGAFIATLYGVGGANAVFIPIGNKLKIMSEDEARLREMTLEGVLAIQAGDNPRIVAEKLQAFVAPELRREPGGEGAAAAPPERDLKAA